MELQDGRRHFGRDRAEERLLHDLGLVGTLHHHEHAARGHDGADAHGVRLARHVFNAVEQAAVRLDGALGEIHAVRAFENVSRAR